MGSKSITINVNVNALALAVCGYVIFKLRRENRELSGYFHQIFVEGQYYRGLSEVRC